MPRIAPPPRFIEISEMLPGSISDISLPRGEGEPSPVSMRSRGRGRYIEYGPWMCYIAGHGNSEVSENHTNGPRAMARSGADVCTEHANQDPTEKSLLRAPRTAWMLSGGD